MNDGVGDGALAGLRILDFSRVLAGPLATMVLGDLGAEVTKVERPGAGDDTRAWGPPYDAQGRATYFDAVNRNKRSIASDLTDPADVAVIRRLAADADVVVENFRPGLLDRFGLGYAQLAAVNPRLIYCSITGFGRTPQAAALPGYDLLVQAMGGLMSITGEADGEPQKVGVALVDVITGLFATVGILAALAHRNATGEGQLVEVDLFSALLAALVNQSSSYTAAGVVPARMGNEHPSIAPYAVFRAGAERIVLAVGNDRQFQDLCRVLGAPALAAEERFATNPARVEHREALRLELERLLAARPAAEWTQLLTDARVPAGAVNDLGDAFELAARLGLEPIVAMASPDGSVVRLPRNPLKLSRTPVSYRLTPPDLPA
ncbi:CaiB/BaiF CoA-transferase family protein [Conexibacter sp. S30A1]|jgi:crotonobetainyl-CoA:carnitine CoA-transferase CaiB-like acyl-CoA transferase|uniref:CaiB/BaiF CoA transferase family protein n=1 Tax=Conexibacter sp. S30A1 TaxID=2937800 RepID=UPI00200D55C7|nr:CoA transferase [Conexibacter sp. S30A1]